MEILRRKINYYECDRMGITHHSNYIRFMEEARIELLDKFGYGFERMEAEGVSSPVVSVECEYKKPTTFRDELVIDVHLEELSALKLKFRYEMKVEGKLACKGITTHCFFENGRPVVIEERFPELCEQLKSMD